MKILQTLTASEADWCKTVTVTTINTECRLWLTATTVVGSTRFIVSEVPFVASLAPSERARAQGSTVVIELRHIPTDEIRIIEWRDKPIVVLGLSQDMLDSPVLHANLLADTTSKRSIQLALWS